MIVLTWLLIGHMIVSSKENYNVKQGLDFCSQWFFHEKHSLTIFPTEWVSPDFFLLNQKTTFLALQILLHILRAGVSYFAALQRQQLVKI